MAISEAGSSNDGAPASRCKYDVFLNFRGEDTRYGFTDFLYDRMVDAGIHVFRDKEELPIGEVIGEELHEAIKNTIIYIPIFSQTYASSKWCLRELALMVDNVSESKGQKSIFPIFFHVEPDDVKLKKSLYKADFKKHEEDFRDEVKAWKGALGKVDERKGWVVEKNTSQASIVKSVVKKVLEKLEIKQKLVTEHLIGLDDRVKHLIELLDVDDPDVLLIGIYGMGGIGKTTVSKVIFNQLSSHFGKYCSFLEDVRESSLTKEGIVQLQKKLLSDIVDFEFAEKVKDSEHGMLRIEKTIKNKKVLVVLDDVDNKAHIKQLIGKNPLRSGSRIIITTRNTSTLQVEGFKGRTRRYEMPQMDDDHALQLFCRHAFVNCPSHNYHGLSREIVSSIGGLPLAIEVMGSLLNEKEKAFWDETLLWLRKVPENEIQKKLRISYDCLDKDQQQIFLDIACFFFNEKMNDVIYVWPNLECYIVRAIDVLTSRCLVKILDNGKFWMHNQLIDLGRQIVQEESRSDLGKQSRLWIAKEALEIIETKERKDKVRALEIDGLENYIKITNEKFERLENLRFLKLGFGTFVGDFADCRSKLRWISWHSPHDFMVDNLYFDHLVVFKLDRSDFTDDSKAWNLIKWAKKLKVLSLTRCNGITMIPDFSICSGLERLTLAFCKELRSVKSFIGDLRSLIELEIKSCTSLTDLPEEVGKLLKLKRFSLLGCSKLKKLPDSLGNLTSLIELDLSSMWIVKLPNSIKGLVNLKTFLLTNTWIEEFPNSIGKLKSLRVLRLPQSFPQNQIWHLPSDIGMLTNLEELDLSGHDGLKCGIPVEIGRLSSLRILNLKGTCISEIPETINRLRHLQTLNLRDCHRIQGLPELPTSLTRLLLQSESLQSVPNMSNLTNLVELLLSDGSPSTGKSNLGRGCDLTWIAGLSRLKKLDLYLRYVPAPPELASLFYLEELTLSYLDLTDLQLPSSLLRLKLQFSRIRGVELLPSSLNLRKLLTLQFYWGEVEEIRLDGLPRLEHLTVYGCKLLKILSIPSGLENLRQVRVSYCQDLEKIEVKGYSQSFGSFTVFDCESLKRIEGLSNFNPVKLQIERCDALTNVEGLNYLEVLESLQVIDCPSLKRLIDFSCTNIPDRCLVEIRNCGDRIKDFEMSYNNPSANSLEYYRKNVDQFTSKRRSVSTSHELEKRDRTDEGSGGRDGSGSSQVPRRSHSHWAYGKRRGGR